MKETKVKIMDKDHVWVGGRQYISLERVGEMIQETTQANFPCYNVKSDRNYCIDILDKRIKVHEENIERFKVSGRMFQNDVYISEGQIMEDRMLMDILFEMNKDDRTELAKQIFGRESRETPPLQKSFRGF